MQQVIKIKTKSYKHDTTVEITAKINSNGAYLTREENKKVKNELTDALFEILKSYAYASEIKISK